MISTLSTLAIAFLADIDMGTVGTSGAISLGTLGGVWKIIKGIEDRIKSGLKAELRIESEGAKTHIANQPLEVRGAVEYATTEALNQLREEMADLRRNVEQWRTDTAQTAEERAIRLHNRIDVISEKVSEVLGQLKLIAPHFTKGGRA